MTTSVAAIAKKVFDSVSLKIGGAIFPCTVTSKSGGTYDPSSGAYVGEVTNSQTGRIVFDVASPKKDMFPSYVLGPSDKVAYIEGLTSAPKEAGKVTVGASQYTITAVADIVMAGAFFAVVLR